MTSRFLVNLNNAPPDAPPLLSPDDGAVVAHDELALVAGRAPDPDLYDALSYRFELATDAGFTPRAATKNVVGDDGGATWSPGARPIGDPRPGSVATAGVTSAPHVEAA